MAWGKTEEEKAAERAAEQQAAANEAARRQQADAQRAAQAYAAGPVGQAEAAAQAGAVFFQTQMDVSRLDGNASWGSASAAVQHVGRPDILGQIESFGWHLEDVGYVFVETGTTSTNRVMLSGEATAVSGVVLGIYLFRNTRLAASG